MDTPQVHRRSLATTAVRTVSIPALVGASLGVVFGLLVPHGNHGDVMSTTH